MRLPRKFAALAFTVVAFGAPIFHSAGAQQSSSALTRLYINVGPDVSPVYPQYSSLRYGGYNWVAMTTLLKASFNITTGNGLPSIDVLRNYDALWMDQRYGEVPTERDIQTMKAFAATGKRIVFIGENSYPDDFLFHNWSAPFIQALGGLQVKGNPDQGWGETALTSCLYGNITPVYSHALTTSITSAYVGCAGKSIGGTSLFDYRVATLWGDRQNVLTILDSNILDDYFGAQAGSPQFRRNIVDWLAADPLSASTVVPEPATYALLAPALLALGALAHKRRRSSMS